MQTGNAIRLKIVDDGIGFDLRQITYGKGLKSIQLRALQIDFKFALVSSPGKGTSVEVWRE